MNKYTKFCASFIIIILLLVLGSIAYAEENVDTQGVGKENRDSFMMLRQENKTKRDEIKKEISEVRENFKTQKEEKRAQLEEMIQTIKEKRQEFKTELESNREQAKLKIAEIKANFKESLNKIRDENKKIATEKIVETIQTLNIKITDHLSDKVDQIENVLVGVQSRISKAEERGLDVSSAKIEVEKAKTAINTARDSISTQSSKVYEINITSESTLKTEMKALRDTFTNDIKAVKEKVKLAHTAVSSVATTLAQIPKIDDDPVEIPKVENNESTTNN